LTPWISTNVAFPLTVQGGEVDLLLGIPGRKPPPPYVAPPFEFAWLPITPSIVVSSAVHETAGFQDGIDPGETVVPWTENWYARSRNEEIISADNSSVLVKAIFRLERIRAPFTIVTTTTVLKGKTTEPEYLSSPSTRD